MFGFDDGAAVEHLLLLEGVPADVGRQPDVRVPEPGGQLRQLAPHAGHFPLKRVNPDS